MPVDMRKEILDKERITIIDIPCGVLIWMERFPMNRHHFDEQVKGISVVTISTDERF